MMVIVFNDIPNIRKVKMHEPKSWQQYAGYEVPVYFCEIGSIDDVDAAKIATKRVRDELTTFQDKSGGCSYLHIDTLSYRWRTT